MLQNLLLLLFSLLTSLPLAAKDHPRATFVESKRSLGLERELFSLREVDSKRIQASQ